MGHIEGECREQMVLFQETIDNLVEEDHPVRFIDAFIDKLDLKSLGFKVKEGETGRFSYKAETLLKIYVYGYLNHIRSSRKLEKECGRNTELMWLTGRLAPDFKTIADFRRDNRKGIKSIFKEFLKLCHKAGLLSFELAGIDGTKISAQNHKNNVYHRNNIDRLIRKLDEKIEKYLQELDGNDREEKTEFEFLQTNMNQRLKSLKSKKEKAEAIKKIFEVDPELEKYYANDPESRFMSDLGKTDIAYNLQCAVESGSKLIIAVDVVNNGNDEREMKRMCDKVEELKKELNEDKKTIKVADAGYHTGNQILDCIDNNHDAYMPNPKDIQAERGKETEGGIPAKAFQLKNFRYEEGQDIYICPKEKELKRYGNKRKSRGVEYIMYKCHSCKNCEEKSGCTNSKKGRIISVPVRKKEIEEFNKKIRSDFGKKVIEKRKELCEHPFGTIKRTMGYSYYLMKGIDNAIAESHLFGLAYNLKRVLAAVGVKKLLYILG